MKRVFLKWTTAICCLLLWTACSGDSKDPDVELSVTPTTVTLDDNNEGIINVASNTNWTVTASDSWVSVNPRSGKGDEELSVRATSDNTEESTRTATITISDKGDKISRVVTIKQKAKPAAASDLRLSVSLLEFDAEGSPKNISITSNTPWTVADKPDWISISRSYGEGSSDLIVSATENTSSSSREGTIKFETTNGKTSALVKVTQAANTSSTLTVTPASIEFTSGANQSFINIKSNTQWIIDQKPEWISCEMNGAGDNVLAVKASENTSTQSREGTIRIKTLDGKATAEIKVTQAAAAGTEASLKVSPTMLEFISGGGIKTITLTSSTKWRVVDKPEWITCNSYGEGNGELSITAAANTTSEKRYGTIKIETNDGKATATVSVSQEAASANLEVSETQMTFSAGSSSGRSFRIYSNQKWTVTDDAFWLNCTPSEGSGDQTISVSVTENNDAQDRSATITVKSGNLVKYIQVKQEAASQPGTLTLTVETTTMSFDADQSEPKSQTFNIRSNTAWTIVSDATWLTFSTTKGEGDQTITVTADNYTETSRSRTAAITIKSDKDSNLKQTIMVTQNAATFNPSFSLSESSFSFDEKGGQKTFIVDSNMKWTVSSNLSWASCSPATGENKGYVTVTVAPNTDSSTRSATITVKASNGDTRQISITQTGSTPETLTLVVETTTMTFNADQDYPNEQPQTFRVRSNTSWSITTSESWLSVSPTKGQNNEDIKVVATTYRDSSRDRQAIITITADKNSSLKRTIAITQKAAIFNTEFKLSETSLSFGSAGGSQTFVIDSNIKWTVSADKDWFRVTPPSGEGKGSINVQVDRNTSTTSREGTVTVKAENGAVAQVKITQQGSSGSVKVTPGTLDFGDKSDTRQIVITASDNWEISTNVDWISFRPQTSGGKGTYTISVTTATNTATTPRNATITIKSGGETAQVAVTQQGWELKLEVSPQIISFNGAGGSENFNINSNTQWRIEKPDDWLTCSAYDGTGDKTITLTASPNTSTNSRTSKIRVTWSGNTREITITQTGASPDPTDATFTVNGVTFKMIAVKGGTFLMGAQRNNKNGDNYDPDADMSLYKEDPVHSVTLTGFCIGETEVTQELWKAVMGTNPSHFQGNKKPVEYITHNECQTFIQKLNQLTGKNFRLPTEAEWEFAARGGTKTKHYKWAGTSSATNVKDFVWYAGGSTPGYANGTTHDVKTKKPNELGLYDMCGNVNEWCADWYDPDYYRVSSKNDPKGPTMGSNRVIRGGSWNSNAKFCRVSNRNGKEDFFRGEEIGLRLAL